MEEYDSSQIKISDNIRAKSDTKRNEQGYFKPSARFL